MRGWLLILALSATATAQAHRLDEYLQATRVSVSPDRVELRLDLTPGVSVLPELLPRMDANHDGRISRKEQRAYARTVIQDLSLTLDDKPRSVKPERIDFPSEAAIREGEGVIRMRATARFPRCTPGHHDILFRNRHLPGISVYQVNALQPGNKTIEIIRQIRDERQQEYRLQFEVKK